MQNESSMAPTETFAERIKRFDLEFTFVLISLMKQINEISYENPNSKLINLVHRYVLNALSCSWRCSCIENVRPSVPSVPSINFNSFYNTHLEQMSCKNAKVNLRSPPL